MSDRSTPSPSARPSSNTASSTAAAPNPSPSHSSPKTDGASSRQPTKSSSPAHDPPGRTTSDEPTSSSATTSIIVYEYLINGATTVTVRNWSIQLRLASTLHSELAVYHESEGEGELIARASFRITLSDGSASTTRGLPVPSGSFLTVRLPNGHTIPDSDLPRLEALGGSAVTLDLVATPDPGWYVAEWTGNCAGTRPELGEYANVGGSTDLEAIGVEQRCQIRVDRDVRTGAIFKRSSALGVRANLRILSVENGELEITDIDGTKQAVAGNEFVLVEEEEGKALLTGGDQATAAMLLRETDNLELRGNSDLRFTNAGRHLNMREGALRLSRDSGRWIERITYAQGAIELLGTRLTMSVSPAGIIDFTLLEGAVRVAARNNDDAPTSLSCQGFGPRRAGGGFQTACNGDARMSPPAVIGSARATYGPNLEHSLNIVPAAAPREIPLSPRGIRFEVLNAGTDSAVLTVRGRNQNEPPTAIRIYGTASVLVLPPNLPETNQPVATPPGPRINVLGGRAVVFRSGQTAELTCASAESDSQTTLGAIRIYCSGAPIPTQRISLLAAAGYEGPLYTVSEIDVGRTPVATTSESGLLTIAADGVVSLLAGPVSVAFTESVSLAFTDGEEGARYVFGLALVSAPVRSINLGVDIPFPQENLAVGDLIGATFSPAPGETFPVSGGYSVSPSGILSKIGNVVRGTVTVRYRATNSGFLGEAAGEVVIVGNVLPPVGLAFGATPLTINGQIITADNANANGDSLNVRYLGENRGLYYAIAAVGANSNGWSLEDHYALCNRTGGIGGGNWRAPAAGEAAVLIAPETATAIEMHHRAQEIGVPGMRVLSQGSSPHRIALPGRRGESQFGPLADGVPVAAFQGVPQDGKLWALALSRGERRPESIDEISYDANSNTLITTTYTDPAEVAARFTSSTDGNFAAFTPRTDSTETIFNVGVITPPPFDPANPDKPTTIKNTDIVTRAQGASGYAACVLEVANDYAAPPELSVLEFRYGGKNVQCPLSSTPSSDCLEGGHPDVHEYVDSSLSDESEAEFVLGADNVAAILTVRAWRFGNRNTGTGLEAVSNEPSFAELSAIGGNLNQRHIVTLQDGDDFDASAIVNIIESVDPKITLIASVRAVGDTGATLIHLPAQSNSQQAVYALSVTTALSLILGGEVSPIYVSARPRFGADAQLRVNLVQTATSTDYLSGGLDDVSLPPIHPGVLKIDPTSRDLWRMWVPSDYTGAVLTLTTFSGANLDVTESGSSDLELSSETFPNGGRAVSLSSPLPQGGATMQLQIAVGGGAAQVVGLVVRPLDIATVYVNIPITRDFLGVENKYVTPEGVTVFAELGTIAIRKYNHIRGESGHLTNLEQAFINAIADDSVSENLPITETDLRYIAKFESARDDIINYGSFNAPLETQSQLGVTPLGGVYARGAGLGVYQYDYGQSPPELVPAEYRMTADATSPITRGMKMHVVVRFKPEELFRTLSFHRHVYGRLGVGAGDVMEEEVYALADWTPEVLNADELAGEDITVSFSDHVATKDGEERNIVTVNARRTDGIVRGEKKTVTISVAFRNDGGEIARIESIELRIWSSHIYNIFFEKDNGGTGQMTYQRNPLKVGDDHRSYGFIGPEQWLVPGFWNHLPDSGVDAPPQHLFDPTRSKAFGINTFRFPGRVVAPNLAGDGFVTSGAVPAPSGLNSVGTELRFELPATPGIFAEVQWEKRDLENAYVIRTGAQVDVGLDPGEDPVTGMFEITIYAANARSASDVRHVIRAHYMLHRGAGDPPSPPRVFSERELLAPIPKGQTAADYGPDDHVPLGTPYNAESGSDMILPVADDLARKLDAIGVSIVVDNDSAPSRVQFVAFPSRTGLNTTVSLTQERFQLSIMRSGGFVQIWNFDNHSFVVETDRLQEVLTALESGSASRILATLAAFNLASAMRLTRDGKNLLDRAMDLAAPDETHWDIVGRDRTGLGATVISTNPAALTAVETLLDWGFPMESASGLPPLEYVVENIRFDDLSYLNLSGAQAAVITTTLQGISIEEQRGLVSILLDAGADPRANDSRVLHLAIQRWYYGTFPVVEELLSGGGNRRLPELTQIVIASQPSVPYVSGVISRPTHPPNSLNQLDRLVAARTMGSTSNGNSFRLGVHWPPGSTGGLSTETSLQRDRRLAFEAIATLLRGAFNNAVCNDYRGPPAGDPTIDPRILCGIL